MLVLDLPASFHTTRLKLVSHFFRGTMETRCVDDLKK